MPNAFAERFRKARLERNMRQSDAAELLGVSEGYVSMWERGQRMPSFEMIETISEAFGVSYGWLMGDTETYGQPDAPTDEELSRWTEEDELDGIARAASMMARLSVKSQYLIKSLIAAAYKQEKAENILQPISVRFSWTENEWISRHYAEEQERIEADINNQSCEDT